MANATLPASAENFKHVSLEYQQLKLTIQLLETLVVRALARGHELGDRKLLIILEQVAVFIFKAQYLMDNFEKRSCGIGA